MGKIFVIEGTDGCGKQTQTAKLLERLLKHGFNAKSLSFPNYSSPSAAPLKMYLAGEVVDNADDLDAYQTSTLFAVDRLLTMKSYEDFLYNDGILILDRYVQSNMIHQAGKIKNTYERNIFLDWLNNFEFEVLKLPKADEVIFLDAPISVTKKLMEKREVLKTGDKKDIHEEDINHLENAYNAGKYVSLLYNWTEIKCTKNDEMMSIDEIHEKIFNHITKHLDIENPCSVFNKNTFNNKKSFEKQL